MGLTFCSCDHRMCSAGGVGSTNSLRKPGSFYLKVQPHCRAPESSSGSPASGQQMWEEGVVGKPLGSQPNRSLPLAGAMCTSPDAGLEWDVAKWRRHGCVSTSAPLCGCLV